MNANQAFGVNSQAISYPVFDGLEALGFSGLDIAEIVCVSPSTISKWRNGYVFAPNEFIVLLTLVLASRLLDILGKDDCGKMPIQECSLHHRTGLESVQEDLEAQERINYNFPSSAVRSGAIRFRYWWHSQQRLKLTEMRMNVDQINQSLSAN